MTIDVLTLLIVDAVVVTICGVSFVLSTVLGRHDDVGRIWSLAFIAGILTALCYALSAAQAQFWAANAVGNGSIVLAMGAMWSGCRRYNGRPSHIWLPLLVAIAEAGVVVWMGPGGGEWAGARLMFIAIAVFSALAGIETVRGKLLLAHGARVLTIVFVVVSVYYLARTSVFAVVGERGPLFTTWFGTITTTFITIALVIIAAISMSILQTARTRTTDDLATQAGSVIGGVLPADAFDQHAGDWLRRARTARLPLVLVLVEVHDLEHLNAVFGREFGDRVIVSVGRVLCEKSPAASVIGRVASRSFAVLTVAPSHNAPSVVADALQTALVETPIDPSTAIRAVATFGVSTTEREGYRLGDLRRAAQSAFDQASPQHGGEILVDDQR